MTLDAVAMVRHDLLTVAPADWPQVAATHLPRLALAGEAAALVARWGRVGWPVIVRRPTAGDARGEQPVGLPLPPSTGKARVALTLPTGVMSRPVKALSLAAARTTAPAHWQATIDALEGLGRDLEAGAHVFGGLLWQSLTGLVYLHPASDLDLLWSSIEAGRVPALLDSLICLDVAAPMRIDGEIRTRFGDVNWRELAAARNGDRAVVLMKSLDRAGFVPVDKLLATDAVS